MDGSRRGFLKAAAAAACAAVTPLHAQGRGEDHRYAQQAVPSDPALRVKSLESLLVEKGLVDRKTLDALIDTYEHKIGPRNGARVVARAWVDSAYKQRLRVVKGRKCHANQSKIDPTGRLRVVGGTTGDDGRITCCARSGRACPLGHRQPELSAVFAIDY